MILCLNRLNFYRLQCMDMVLLKKNLAVFDVYKQIMKPKLLSQVNTDQFLCFMFIGL